MLDETRLLPARAVLRLLPDVAPATFYRWVRQGAFPAPAARLGPQSSRWKESDVRAWLEAHSTVHAA